MDNFWIFEVFFSGFFRFFVDFLKIFWIFRFLNFLKNVFNFFWTFLVLGITFKVTMVTTKSHQGYYWTPKIDKNGPTQQNMLFFAQMAKKAWAEGQSPPQELEVGLHSGPYLLVFMKI